MPLVMEWYKYTSYYNSYALNYSYAGNSDTTNASSVHQSSLTFTATSTEFYRCRVACSPPTGIVVPGVNSQTASTHGTFFSSPFVSRTVASKTTVCLHVNVDVVSIADYYYPPYVSMAGYILSLLFFSLSGYRYLGDGGTDRREILHDGNTYRFRTSLLPFWRRKRLGIPKSQIFGSNFGRFTVN